MPRRIAKQNPVAQGIARRIQARRRHLRYKQEEVAEALSVTANTYAKWDNGTSEPSVTDLIRVAATLRTTVAYLVGEISQLDEEALAMAAILRQIPPNKRAVALAALDAMRDESGAALIGAGRD